MDRRALVDRANVVVTSVDPQTVLSVGNGQTAFTADVTGLQTLNATYLSPPLLTQTHADWGWHVTPPPAGVEPLRFTEAEISARNHSARYPVLQPKLAAETAWLRANPHRLSLLRLFLRRTDPRLPPIAPSDLRSPRQTLHLWNGTLTSSFELDGAPVSVVTAVHPSLDALATRVCSAAVRTRPGPSPSPDSDSLALALAQVRSRRLGLGLAFPYGSEAFQGGLEWGKADRHASTLVSGGRRCDGRPVLLRRLDATTHYVHLALGGGGCPHLAAGRVPHDWSIARAEGGGAEGGVEGGVEGGASGEGSACLDATLWLSPAREQVAPPSAAEVFAAAAAHWPREWSRGAALDLSGSAAKGAAALEAPCLRTFL